MVNSPAFFAKPSVIKTDLEDGAFILKSTQVLGEYPDNICQHLHRWATEAPVRVFLADRLGKSGVWRKVTFAEALAKVTSLAQALLDMGVSEDSPMVILSDNSIENGLLQLAAMYVGIPVVPVSPAYSLISKDFAKLKHIVALVHPGAIFVQDGDLFAKALAAIAIDSGRVVAATNVPKGAVKLDDLLQVSASATVETRFIETNPDTIAKILFTSGSTGLPKGTLNPQRMICANQQMLAQVWPFIEQKPPVILDWLPWNHTFGGNHNFNMILRNGGSLYVDNGKPVPGLIEKTLDNLHDVSPTISFNVPLGYNMLVSAFEESESLRDAFFKNLDLIFYAAAALPQSVWKRLEALSEASLGVKVPMVSSWGATETGPLATAVHFPIERAGVIGNPVPGTEVKMVPNGSKLELRVKGPSVMVSYLSDPQKTAAAFDQDGFYLTGDAGRLAEASEPSKGVVFDGRTAEDFKLEMGTWVTVGMLRVQIIAVAGDVIQDLVITGHDRRHIGILIFPNEAGMRNLVAHEDKGMPLDQLLSHDKVVTALQIGLARHNQEKPASSTRVSLAMFLREPPSIDANEITDKGYLNQRAVLERRHESVQRLYDGGAGCIQIDEGAAPLASQ